MKKTLVFGGSPDPERPSNKAIKALRKSKIETVSIGLREAKVGDVKIEKFRIDPLPNMPFENIHTITFYLTARNQKAHYDYLLSLNPKRFIFNPGTENEELKTRAREEGVSVLEADTLELLKKNKF